MRLFHVIIKPRFPGRFNFGKTKFMKPARFFLMTLLITCFFVTSSCSQKKSIVNAPVPDVFAGSTPCDSLIRSLLKIPSDATCVFIKWDLSLYKSKTDTGIFQLSVSYGDYQPNSMEFQGGGSKINISGKYSTGHGTNSNPRRKEYHLMGNEGHPELFLIKMDNNIFHFADRNWKFIIGSGTFGYVLNRIK
jgi:hypothetical protein